MTDDTRDSNLLTRYGGTNEKTEPDTKHPCFSVLSANRSGGPKLVLRFKNGNQRALDYSYLPDVEMDGKGLIVAHFVGHRVTVRGRNLSRVFDALVAHKLNWMAEHGHHEDNQVESDLWINEIVVEEV